MIDLVSLELKDKFSTNGTSNLTGNIGSYVEAVLKFIVHWELEDMDATFSGNQIIANDTSNWITAGFKVGDTITVVTSSSDTSNDGDYEIIGISSSSIWVANTGSSSSVPSFTTLVGATISVYGTTPVTKIDYYFGLVENSSTAAYVSLLDGETQKYRAINLDSSSISAGNPLTPNTVNKSWLTGSTTEQGLTVVDTLGTGTSYVSTGYEQYFQITHVFHISPAFIEEWVNTSDEIDSSLATWFTSSNALKFVPRIVAGYTASTEDHNTDNGNLAAFLQNGDTGFYDEYRNGASANYSLYTLSFTNSAGDAVTAISSNDDTDVQIRITNNLGGFSSDSRFDIYLFEIPEDTADYKNLTSDQWTNFDVSNVFIAEADSPASDNNITSADVSTSFDTAIITFTHTATNDDTKKYLIFVDVGDLNIPTSDNNHNVVLCSFGQFTEYINTDDIIVRSGTKINEHSTNDLQKAYSDFAGWNEDGFLVTDNIRVKKTIGLSDEYNVELTGLSVNVSCEHATDSTRNFVLENIVYSIPESSTRNFILYSGDPKNYKVLTQETGDANYYEYTLEHATKIRFENNIPLPTADSDFTSPSQKWSIYNLPPDWSVYLNIVTTYDILNGTTLHETYTNTHKVSLGIKDYNEYQGCEITGSIQTYHPTTGASLSGKILRTANTKVVATFYGEEIFPCIYNLIDGSCGYDMIQSGSGSFSSGESDLDSCPDYYGILRLTPYNGTEDNIREISTVIDETETDSPWIGELATNKAVLVAYPYASPPYIQVRATIDYTKLDTTLPNYTISARLGKQAATICQVSIQEKWTTSDTSYTNTALSGYTDNDLLVFNGGREKTVSNNANLTGSTLAINNPFAGILKICCAKNKISGTSNGSGEFTHASLVGLSIDDFIGFAASTGREITTITGVTFNSGLGKLSGLPASVYIEISFHVALISDSVTGIGTYTDPLLSGLVGQDVMIFVNGVEEVTELASIFGTTITFASAVTGSLKVVKVNQ